MAFGAPPKGKPTRPGDAKAAALAQLKARRAMKPEDITIENSLQQVLSDQELLEKNNEVVAEDYEQSEIDAPLVRLVNSLLAEAVKGGASDIHIEPFETLLRVRFRIDGVLREIQKIPHKLASAITSRIKIMADMDICEKRISQDGSFKFRMGNIDADFRVSTLPSMFGEKVVMRVMGTTNVNNNLSNLGFPVEQLKIFREAIAKPDGLVLVTGPTGSGKTTTLYAALNELNDISVSVFTAEDPVEGTLPGVTQAQVNTAVGYTFASILRSFLRQDPDVILVGEIRDQETAEISIKAALTGHLVLSTLHTNCAVSTISRLINMGIAPYLLTSSINCIVAQRLVRKICPDCKQEISVPPEMLIRLGSGAGILNGSPMWHGKGCAKCHNSGYKGRAPIYEVLSLSDELRRLILSGASREELKRLAREQGMQTLRESGLALVKSGTTSIEEVLGVTNEDSPSDAAPIQVPSSPLINAQIPEPVQVKAETQIVDVDSLGTTPAEAQPQVDAAMLSPNDQTANEIPKSTQAGAQTAEEQARKAAQRWKLMKQTGPRIVASQ